MMREQTWMLLLHPPLLAQHPQVTLRSRTAAAACYILWIYTLMLVASVKDRGAKQCCS